MNFCKRTKVYKYIAILGLLVAFKAMENASWRWGAEFLLLLLLGAALWADHKAWNGMTRAALRKSDQRLRTIFNQAGVGVAEIDSFTGRFLRVNEEYCRIVGYSRGEMERLTFKDITCPEDLEEDLDHLRELVEGKIGQFNMEKRYRRKDGGIAWVTLTVAPLWGPGEPVSSHIAVVTDITERKLAEMALQRQNRLQELLVKLAARHINLPLEEVDRALFDSLDEMAAFVDADRISIFEYDFPRQLCNGVLEWKRAGLEPQIVSFRNLSIPEIPEWNVEAHRRGEPIWLADVQDLPPGKLRELVEPSGTRCSLAIPIMIRGECQGFVSFAWGKPIQINTGEEQRLLMIFAEILVNIRLRKQADEALRKSQERLRLATDAANIGVWDWNLATNELVWDDSMYHLYGLKREAFSGAYEAWLSCIHRDDTTFVQEEIQAALRGEREYAPAFRILRPDGETRILQARSKTYRDGNGIPVRMIGTNVDITNRKRLEEDLRNESEWRRALLEIYEKASQLTDQELHDFALDNAVRLTRSEIGFLYRVSEDQQSIILAAWNRETLQNCNVVSGTHYPLEKAGNWADCVRDGKPAMYNDYTSSPHQKGMPEGHTPMKRLLCIPVMDEGKACLIFGVGNKAYDYDDQDIVHLQLLANELQKIVRQREADQSLKSAKALAEEANHAKDQFIAILSHELRTPLMPVMATVTELEMRESLGEGLRESLSIIRRNIELESRLIDDLLDLTRISRGKIFLQEEPLDVHTCLHSALEICQSAIAEKGLQITLKLKAGNHHVLADPTHLRQAFWNLLSNALKFTPQGGHITIQTDNDAERRIRITFADTGIGIPADVMARIFSPFEQAELTKTRRFGGLGLGLSIAKAVVEMHQGTLTAFSEGKNKGATFTIILATISSSPAPAAAPAATESKATTRRILLVEDHPDTLRTMTKLLHRWGHTVTSAVNVRQALDRLAGEPFDFLISDLGLPDGSGMDILREARQHPGLRAIALSGYGTEEDIRQSREAGFEAHLVKPINFEDLKRAIR